MLLIKKQGFTLIELMVVIVIIGVLASLAIPRFTDASIKAKIAEAPRVLASFESAYLAAEAEGSLDATTTDALIFANPPSKWFLYAFTATGVAGDKCVATATGKIGGAVTTASTLGTEVNTAKTGFNRTAPGLTKYVPNFKSD